MRVLSDFISSSGVISPENTCDGANIAPQIRWQELPARTQSLVVLMEDVKAPQGLLAHWVVFDIPPAAGMLPEGAVGVGKCAQTDFGVRDYRGPCPPAWQQEHEYVLKLFALDVPSLDLPEGASREEVVSAMMGHVLAEAETIGRYDRRVASRTQDIIDSRANIRR